MTKTEFQKFVKQTNTSYSQFDDLAISTKLILASTQIEQLLAKKPKDITQEDRQSILLLQLIAKDFVSKVSRLSSNLSSL